MLAEGYEVIVTLDADFSHDPAVIPVLLGLVEDGTDLAVGSRYVPGGATPNWPAYRLALSRYGNRYAGWMLGLRLRDATSGFRAYRAELLSDIRYETTESNGYAFMTELAYRASAYRAEVARAPHHLPRPHPRHVEDVGVRDRGVDAPGHVVGSEAAAPSALGASRHRVSSAATATAASTVTATSTGQPEPGDAVEEPGDEHDRGQRGHERGDRDPASPQDDRTGDRHGGEHPERHQPRPRRPPRPSLGLVREDHLVRPPEAERATLAGDDHLREPAQVVARCSRRPGGAAPWPRPRDRRAPSASGPRRTSGSRSR